jgi:hypothetical protein
MISPMLRVLEAGKQVEIFCYDHTSEENKKVPRFTLHVVDHMDEKILAKRDHAAIIFPEGKQGTLVASEIGRENISKQVNVARIVIIRLGNGHTFGSLPEVQEELSSKILELAPDLCSNRDKITVMAAAEDLGKKNILPSVGTSGIIV